MTIRRTTLTLAVAGSLMMSVPVFANDDHNGGERSNRAEIVQNQYSGSESTMVPVEPSTSYEQPMTLVDRERDHSNR